MLKATCKECGAWIQVEAVGARYHEITLNKSHILCSAEQTRRGRDEPAFDYSTCPEMVEALNACLQAGAVPILSETA
jgi:hypothetical protein